MRKILLAPAIAGAALALAALGQASATPVAHAAPTSAGPAAALRTHHFIPGRTRVSPDRAGTTAAQSSENWSGYIQSGGSGAYGSSQASWTVPTLKTDSDGYSSTWVGIDGASSGDAYLIQTGTEADVVDGQPSYDAWWEVITPSDEAPEVVYSNVSISPGDSITASVAKGSGGRWTMNLTDNSTGQVGTHTASYAGPGESAEWIQEDTDVNGSISAAPDWQQVNFSGITTNGANPGLDSSQSVDIVDSQGTQEDSTSAPNGSGDGFGVTWLAAGTPTPTG